MVFLANVHFCPVCESKCLMRLDFSAKVLLQYWHEKGFTPVWILSCLFTFPLMWEVYGQKRHWCGPTCPRILPLDVAPTIKAIRIHTYVYRIGASVLSKMAWMNEIKVSWLCKKNAQWVIKEGCFHTQAMRQGRHKLRPQSTAGHWRRQLSDSLGHCILLFYAKLHHKAGQSCTGFPGFECVIAWTVVNFTS